MTFIILLCSKGFFGFLLSNITLGNLGSFHEVCLYNKGSLDGGLFYNHHSQCPSISYVQQITTLSIKYQNSGLVIWTFVFQNVSIIIKNTDFKKCTCSTLLLHWYPLGSFNISSLVLSPSLSLFVNDFENTLKQWISMNLYNDKDTIISYKWTVIFIILSCW